MIEPSPKQSIPVALTVWHYKIGFRGLVASWRNFLVFTVHYFPVWALIKTFFSHWKSLKEPYSKNMGLKNFFHVLLGNIISRGVGAFARLVLIVIGLISEVIVFVAGLVVIFFWIYLPILLVLGVFAGIGLLFGL